MDKYVVAPPSGSTNNSVGAADRHWKEGHFDSVKLNGGDLGEYLAESIGYGIVSGCEPTISGLTVTVGAGIVHLAGGTRKELSASTVTLDAADSTNPRIDLVYIDSTGAVAKVTGTAAASPSVPALPTGGISVCNVSVAAGATTGTVKSSKDLAVITAKNVLKAAQINNVMFLSRFKNVNEAIDRIDNSVLVIDTSISSADEILIDRHTNFTIIGEKNSFIDASIKITNCSNFAIKGLRTGGTTTKNTFYVMYSHDFSLSECFIDGTSNRKHEGLHVYDCYNLNIYNNHVQYSELDGILVHANCYNFAITNNLVEYAGAIGIEVEGRTDGDRTNPVYARCHDGIVSDNVVGANWQSILCLFSDYIVISGNNCKSAIDVTGSTCINVVGNEVNTGGYGLVLGVEFFTFDKTANYCKNINITNNHFTAQTGVLDSNWRGWDGLITVRGAENVNFASNTVKYLGAEGINQDVAYITIFDTQFMNVNGNIFEPNDHAYKPYFGIKLIDESTEYPTETLIHKGLYEINITNNYIRNCYWLIGSDVFGGRVSIDNKVSDIYNVKIENNSLYGGTDNQCGLALMYFDNSCAIHLGRNIIRDCNEALTTFGSDAKITSSDYQDALNYGPNSTINISPSITYLAGDTIYNPSTTEAFKVCVTGGTPGTWKSVALS